LRVLNLEDRPRQPLHRVSYLVAMNLLILLQSLQPFSKSQAKELESNFSKGSPQLHFPALPQEIVARIEGKPQTKESLNSQVDPLLNQQWGLADIGFFDSFTPLIQPVRVQVNSCSNQIVVAVVDTGIDYTHNDLKNNIWINPGESGPWMPKDPNSTTCRDKSCNGIDDDGDGFIDDVVGWDFVNNQPLPYDTHGHGTHIAGIIGAQSANGMGISGICPEVLIMPLKYYDSGSNGMNNLTNTVKAIQYAVKLGANIINYSGGGAEPAAAERAAIEEAERKGILFVAAAGNDGHDNSASPYYPASYPLDNIIGVASVNQKNQLLSSSNFGSPVHIAAPGLGILSTIPGGKFGTMSGTSQATAFVTGAAALLASQNPSRLNFDYRQVKDWILKGAKPLPSNEQKKLVSSGLLSIPGSLTEATQEKNLAKKKSIPAAIALIPLSKSKKKIPN
jgi:subtilisin family serine protease